VVQNREEIDEERYRRYFDHFDGSIRSKALGAAAREAGMKYFVVTTKSTRGLLLWDSKYTDWKRPTRPR